MRHRIAVREIKETGELSKRVMVRSSQYLNNLIEQDHGESNSGLGRCWGSNDSTTRRSPLAESNWRKRSRRASSRLTSSVIASRACRNCRVRRSPLEPIADTQYGKAQPTSPLTRVCTRAEYR